MPLVTNQFTNSKMHSTPTDCTIRKNDKTYSLQNSHALSPHVQASVIYLLSVLCNTVRLNCKVPGSRSRNVNPRKGALLRHRNQTDRQCDMDIPAFYDQHWSLCFIHIP